MGVAAAGGVIWRLIDGPPLNGSWEIAGAVLLLLAGLAVFAQVFGARLVLDADGLVVAPSLRQRRIPWHRIGREFRVVRSAYSTNVEFVLEPEEPPFGDGRVHRRAVPTWFGLKPVEQARLMAQFRDAFGEH